MTDENEQKPTDAAAQDLSRRARRREGIEDEGVDGDGSLDNEGAGEEGTDDAAVPLNRAARRAAAARGEAPAQPIDRNAAIRAEAARSKERQSATAQSLDLGERVDDVFARITDSTLKWVKRNSSVLQGALALSVLVGLGYHGWGIYSGKRDEARGDRVAQLLAAEFPQKDGAAAALPAFLKDLEGRERFATDEARLDAITTRLAVVRSSGGSALEAEADYAAARALLHQGKADEAVAKFQSVATGKLAAKDVELRGRALEGIVLALEAAGKRADAQQALAPLRAIGEDSFTLLADYHAVRFLAADGKKDDAVKALGELEKKLAADGAPRRPFLQEAVRSLRQQIAPGSNSAAAAPPMSGLDTSDPKKLQELLQQLKGAGLPGNLPQGK